MNVYENESFVVKSSPIEGFGLFSKKIFMKDDIVLYWNSKRLTIDELRDLPDDQKQYLKILEDGTDVLMQAPERYVNHSDNPNTYAVGESDVALRDIQIGEEITSTYKF